MKTTLLFLFLLVSTIVSAQSDTLRLRIFGIGMKTLNLFNELNQSLDVFPGNRIVMMITPTKNFRIQPEIGMSSQGTFNSILNDDVTNSTFLIGTALVGMWQYGRTNLYGGLKYLHSSVTMEDVDIIYLQNGGISYTKMESKTNFNTMGLLVGGEYFLGDHFSVGAEAGYQRTTGKNDESTNDDEKATFSSTETNLLMRFYF